MSRSAHEGNGNVGARRLYSAARFLTATRVFPDDDDDDRVRVTNTVMDGFEQNSAHAPEILCQRIENDRKKTRERSKINVRTFQRVQ